LTHGSEICPTIPRHLPNCDPRFTQSGFDITQRPGISRKTVFPLPLLAKAPEYHKDAVGETGICEQRWDPIL
jgi:hypothetical protein